MTIREAATLLGVHPNTVRNHVKAGFYRAEKVVTERGETWMIDRDSLITSPPTRASQQIVNPQAVTFAQELLRPFVQELGQVREQLGAERARREQAERTVEELRQEIASLRQPAESPTAGAEEPGRAGPRPSTGGPQEAAEPRSWWRRMFGG